jgi:hypothetical protein
VIAAEEDFQAGARSLATNSFALSIQKGQPLAMTRDWVTVKLEALTGRTDRPDTLPLARCKARPSL